MNTEIVKFKGDPGKLKKFEPGMVMQAASEGKSVFEFLEKFITTPEGGGFEPTEYHGLSNTERLTRKMALGDKAPLDAFELAMAAWKINSKGMESDTVGKFYQSTGSAVLYPWFIMNEVHAGSLQQAIWPSFIAVTNRITGDKMKKYTLLDSKSERQTGQAGRGSLFRKVNARVSDNDIYLQKYGVELEFEYEVFADSPLNIHALFLQRIGAQIGIDETNDLFDVMVNGDGNSGTGLESAQTKETATSAVITKADIIRLAVACPAPYQLNVFVGPTNYLIKYWDTLSDMNNPQNQKAEIDIPLPKAFRWDDGFFGTTTDRFVGVDSRNAIGYTTNDAMNMTEQDRIINKQTIVTVISKRGAFYNIEQDAIGCLDIEH